MINYSQIILMRNFEGNNTFGTTQFSIRENHQSKNYDTFNSMGNLVQGVRTWSTIVRHLLFNSSAMLRHS